MARGKTISLFMMDAMPEGRVKCTYSMWKGIVYKIPRTDIGKCKDIAQVNYSGVYFLFGTDINGKEQVYVGQANSRKNGKGILGRILEPHKSINDWTEVVMLTTSDDSFGATEISYLENRFCNLAKEVGRYDVVNGNEPPLGNQSEELESEMEDAIDITKMMIGALGYKVFSPKRMPVDAKGSNEPVLYMERSGTKASGQRIPDGFVVFKGSIISKTTVKSCPEIAIKYRQKYINSIDKNFVLKEDLVFSSPSSAAAFVGGSSLSGNELWKTKEGVPLKELQ